MVVLLCHSNSDSATLCAQLQSHVANSNFDGRNYSSNNQSHPGRLQLNFQRASWQPTRMDVHYRAFELFLEQPKTHEERKSVTNRIVIKEDTKNVFYLQ
jgi:hypothetical protein